jgi:hypothetical protein
VAWLRVLNGPHTGVRCPLHQERVLVGNLRDECDIVLDVKAAGQHACLLRVSPDGWSVLPVTGDLWLQGRAIAPHTRTALQAFDVLTLGRLSFALGPEDAPAWEAVQPPQTLETGQAGQAAPRLALPASPPALKRQWRAAELSLGLMLAALVLVLAFNHIRAVQLREHATPHTAVRLQGEWQASVQQLGLPYPLEIEPNPLRPGAAAVRGYVQTRAQREALGKALQTAVGPPELRVHVLDELLAALAERLALPPESLSHQGQGVVRAQVAPGWLQPGRERLITSIILESPGLNGLDLHETPSGLAAANSTGTGTGTGTGTAPSHRYRRGPQGSVQADHRHPEPPSPVQPPPAAPAPPIKALSVRLGPRPSVLLDNGQRYFEGATLPDGRVLERITERQLVLQGPQGQQTVPVR